MSNSYKISEKLGVTIGVGILSWRAPKTLEKSLQSYENLGFKELFNEVKIIFQEVSEEDKKLAIKYGYEFVGTENNLGIQKGHQLIFENLNTDYILVLENDNPIVENEEIMKERLFKSVELIKNNEIDIMRLRHRWLFGENFSLGKYLSYYNIQNLHEKYIFNELDINKKHKFLKFLKRAIRPSKAIRRIGYGLYFEKEPDKIFPKYVKKVEEEIFLVSSEVMNWTNQSILLKKDLYGNLLEYAYQNPSSRTANGFQDLEKPLNCNWWRKQKFRIGICEGLFSHNRFDDSWRKNHKSYNENYNKLTTL